MVQFLNILLEFNESQNEFVFDVVSDKDFASQVDAGKKRFKGINRNKVTNSIDRCNDCKKHLRINLFFCEKDDRSSNRFSKLNSLFETVLLKEDTSLNGMVPEPEPIEKPIFIIRDDENQSTKFIYSNNLVAKKDDQEPRKKRKIDQTLKKSAQQVEKEDESYQGIGDVIFVPTDDLKPIAVIDSEEENNSDESEFMDISSEHSYSISSSSKVNTIKKPSFPVVINKTSTPSKTTAIDKLKTLNVKYTIIEEKEDISNQSLSVSQEEPYGLDGEVENIEKAGKITDQEAENLDNDVQNIQKINLKMENYLRTLKIFYPQIVHEYPISLTMLNYIPSDTTFPEIRNLDHPLSISEKQQNGSTTYIYQKTPNSSLWITNFDLLSQKCEFCDLMLPSIEDLAAHRMVTHFFPDESEICSFCENIFKSKQSQQFHSLYCKEKDSNFCDKCQERYENKSEYKLHMFESHGVKFDKKSKKIKFDVKSFTPDGKRIITCNHCEAIFHYPISLRTHLVSKHFPQVSKFICPDCGKAFVLKMMLDRHSASHDLDSQTRKVLQKILLKKKKNTVSQIKEDQFTCESCGKNFLSKHILLNHQKTHLAEYICSDERSLTENASLPQEISDSLIDNEEVQTLITDKAVELLDEDMQRIEKAKKESEKYLRSLKIFYPSVAHEYAISMEMLNYLPSNTTFPEVRHFDHPLSISVKQLDGNIAYVYQEKPESSFWITNFYLLSLKCEFCGLILSSVGDLAAHRMVTHFFPDKSEICSTCENCFKTIQSKQFHSLYCIEKDSTFCDKCQERYSTKSEFNTHMFESHGIKFDAKLKQKQFGLKIVSLDGKRHLKCYHCKMSYNFPCSLRQHLINKHFPSVSKHVCPDCGQAFFLKSDLNKHVLLHEVDKEEGSAVERLALIMKKKPLVSQTKENNGEHTNNQDCRTTSSPQVVPHDLVEEVQPLEDHNSKQESQEITHETEMVVEYLDEEMQDIEETKQKYGRDIRDLMIFKSNFQHIYSISLFMLNYIPTDTILPEVRYLETPFTVIEKQMDGTITYVHQENPESNLWITNFDLLSLKCEFCDLVLPSVESLAAHRMETHFFPDNSEICSNCENIFKSKQSQQFHSLYCKEKDATFCGKCQERYGNKSEYKLHMFESHEMDFIEHDAPSKKMEFDEKLTATDGRRVMKCNHCERLFHHPSTLKRHLITKHFPVVSNYVCPNCFQAFLLKSELTKHLASHDIAEQEKKALRRREFINQRKKTVREIKDGEFFTCELCGKIFRLKQQLINHKKSHLDDSERPYKCEYCGAGYNEERSLEEHTYNHTGE